MKMASVLCALAIFLSCLPGQAFAARSRAGGGDLAEFDTGAFITSSAITVGSTLLTAGIGNAWSSASQSAAASASTISKAKHVEATLKMFPSHLAGGFKSLGSLSAVMPVITRGYTTAFAVSEVGGAIGAIGAYKGWSPSKIYLASTIAGAAVGSFLNPEIALGRPVKGMPTASLVTPKGLFVGTMEGTARGFTIYAIDRKRIDQGKGPSALGQIAGMVAGAAGTSFGRALFNQRPIPVENVMATERPGEQAYYKNRGGVATEVGLEDELAARSQLKLKLEFTDPTELGTGPSESVSRKLKWEDGEKYVYLRVEGMKGGVPRLGPEVDMGNFVNVGYFAEQSGPYVTISQLGKVNPFKAAVLDTANMWPEFATRAVGILAVNALPEKKQYLAPLVSGLSEAIIGPVLSGVADTYGLRPGAHIGYGGKEGNISAKIYTAIGRQERIIGDSASKANEGLDKIYAKHMEGEYREDLPKLRAALAGYLKKIDPALELPSNEDEFAKIQDNMNADQSRLSDDKSMNLQLRESLASAATGFNNEPLKLTNVAMQVAQDAFRQKAKDSLRLGSTAELSEKFGINKGETLGRDIMDSWRYNLPSALISGALSAITGKAGGESKPGVLIASYGVNMLSAAMRGAAWHRNKNFEHPDFIDKLDIVEPEKPMPLTGQSNSQEEYANFLVAETSYARNIGPYRESQRLTGFNPKSAPVGTEGDKKATIASIMILPGKPSRAEAVAASVAQANLEVFAKTFALGYPLKPSEQVSASEFSDYNSSLIGIGSRGIFNAINSSFLGANISAASNNIRSMMAQSISLSKAFNIMPERLVKTDVPGLPLTIQQMSHDGSRGITYSDLLYPFPNPLYQTRQNTGSLSSWRVKKPSFFPEVTER